MLLICFFFFFFFLFLSWPYNLMFETLGACCFVKQFGMGHSFDHVKDEPCTSHTRRAMTCFSLIWPIGPKGPI